MKPIEATTSTLNWEQVEVLRSRLLANGEVVGFLEWATPRGSTARGESANGRWTFSRTGVLHPKVIVRSSGAEDLAAMTMGMVGGGRLTFRDGRAYRITPSGFWRSEWQVADSQRRSMFTVRPDLTCKTARGEVQMSEPVQNPDTSLLILLSWYVILLFPYDYTSSGVAAIVATGAI